SRTVWDPVAKDFGIRWPNAVWGPVAKGHLGPDGQRLRRIWPMVELCLDCFSAALLLDPDYSGPLYGDHEAILAPSSHTDFRPPFRGHGNGIAAAEEPPTIQVERERQLPFAADQRQPPCQPRDRATDVPAAPPLRLLLGRINERILTIVR